MLRLLIDENIPLAKEAFFEIGEVRLIPGRTITNQMLRDIEVLIVRSVTPVNAALLDKTPVRFVGTATIGVDHLDVDYLREKGIEFANAAGSNANSVAEYVMASVVHYACEKQMRLSDLTMGIVGVGHVGSRVVQFAQALGLRVLQNDPPRERAENSKHFVSLDEALQSDIVSLHTPLTMAGSDATFHLLDAPRLAQMKAGSLLINTARGGVVDTAALKTILSEGRLTAYLDVWENEPEIDGELLQHAGIGTPHIAGYSYDGKINGTLQIYEALCKFLGRPPAWRPAALPQSANSTISLEKPSTAEECLRLMIRSAYDIVADSNQLKLAAKHSRQERGQHFDAQRAQYPIRREFSSYIIAAKHLDDELVEKFRALGFQINVD